MEKVTPLAVITDLNAATGTHEGMVGKNNEDSLGFYAWQAGEKIVYMGIVADGVGGQTAGETASQMTVDIIETHFSQLTKLDETELLQHMEMAIHEANQQVYDRALNEDELQGMATTVVVAAVIDNRLYTSHVGDSRIYLLRGAEMHQLTVDHSWVQEAVSAGLLTAEQARHHPNKNVIRRSLGGMSEVEVDQRPQSTQALQVQQGLQLQPHDMILLCSDGLSDMISDEEIQTALETYRSDLDAAVDDLIDRANAAGGRDNISVVLMQIPGNGEVEATAPPKDKTAVQEPGQTPSAAAPKVVSVPPSKTQQERQARRRRLWLIAIAVLTILVLLLVLFLQRPGV